MRGDFAISCHVFVMGLIVDFVSLLDQDCIASQVACNIDAGPLVSAFFKVFIAVEAESFGTEGGRRWLLPHLDKSTRVVC